MRITKRQLKRIIKEEKAKILAETTAGPPISGDHAIALGGDYGMPPRNDPGHAMLDVDDYDDLRESLQEFAKEYAHNTGYDYADIINAMKSIAGDI